MTAIAIFTAILIGYVVVKFCCNVWRENQELPVRVPHTEEDLRWHKNNRGIGNAN